MVLPVPLKSDGGELFFESQAATAAGLSGHVDFPGYVDERERIVGVLRNADILLFCRKTENRRTALSKP